MDTQTLELLRHLQGDVRDPGELQSVQRLLRETRPALRSDDDLATLADISELLEEWAETASPELGAEALAEAADVAEHDLDQPERALQLLKLALDLSPADLRVLGKLEALMRSRGEHERLEALVAAQAQALRGRQDVSPSVLAHVYRLLGQMRVEHSGNIDRAIEAYESALDSDADADILRELADLYALRGAEGDPEEAADLYCTLGDALGNPDGIPLLERALDQDPSHEAALDLLEAWIPVAEQAQKLKTRWAAYIDTSEDVAAIDSRRMLLARVYASEGHYRDALLVIAPLADKGDATASAMREAFLENLEGERAAHPETADEKPSRQLTRALPPRSGQTQVGFKVPKGGAAMSIAEVEQARALLVAEAEQRQREQAEAALAEAEPEPAAVEPAQAERAPKPEAPAAVAEAALPDAPQAEPPPPAHARTLVGIPAHLLAITARPEGEPPPDELDESAGGYADVEAGESAEGSFERAEVGALLGVVPAAEQDDDDVETTLRAVPSTAPAAAATSRATSQAPPAAAAASEVTPSQAPRPRFPVVRSEPAPAPRAAPGKRFRPAAPSYPPRASQPPVAAMGQPPRPSYPRISQSSHVRASQPPVPRFPLVSTSSEPALAPPPAYASESALAPSAPPPAYASAPPPLPAGGAAYADPAHAVQDSGAYTGQVAGIAASQAPAAEYASQPPAYTSQPPVAEHASQGYAGQPAIAEYPSQPPPAASHPAPAPSQAPASALPDSFEPGPRRRFDRRWVIAGSVAAVSVLAVIGLAMRGSTPPPPAASEASAEPSAAEPKPTPAASKPAASKPAHAAETSGSPKPRPKPRTKSRAKSRGPNVHVATAQIRVAGGSIAKPGVASALGRSDAKLERCYRQALKRKPKMVGRQVIRFAVKPNGRASGASLQGGSIKDKALAACTSKIVNATRFPKPKGGKVRVSVPFVYDK